MKEKPILFQAEMVRAIIDGRKTQTRRLFKVADPMGKKHAIGPHEKVIQLGHPGDIDDFHYESTGGLSGPYPCPHGQPGGILWVRENFKVISASAGYECSTEAGFDFAEGGALVEYSADGQRMEIGDLGIREDGVDEGAQAESLAKKGKTTPSIHMPRWASRLDLGLFAVRCEPLQAITEADAIAEGIMFHDGGRIGNSGWRHDINHGYVYGTATAAYKHLWNSINGKPSPVYEKNAEGKKVISYYVSYPWDECEFRQPDFRGKPHYATGNPWVWVLDFAILKG